MKRWALWVALACTLCGAGVALVSTLQHQRVMREGFERQSYCAISEAINCDTVNASSYAEVLGVPIAWWGFCLYIFLGGVALSAARSKKDRRGSVAIAWFLSIASVVYSVFLAYVAWGILGVWCLECLAMYAVNLALFFLFFAALGVPARDVPKLVGGYLRALVGKASSLDFAPRLWSNVAAAALVLLAGWVAFAAATTSNRDNPEAATLREKLSAFFQQSLYTIEPNPAWPVWGNPKARVTIVEFSEFQCPFCRLAAFGVRPYLQEFRDDLRYFFVNYPLDSACNSALSAPMHPAACMTSRAGICAQKFGDFWSFHDALFRSQAKISEELVYALAEKYGWKRDDFAACMAAPETAARLQQEIAAGNGIYVTGTPTIFLNDRKVRYWRDPKFLQAAVREEIKKAKKQK